MALDKITLDRLNQDVEAAKDLIAYNLAVAAKQAYLATQTEEAKKAQVTATKVEEPADEIDTVSASSYVEIQETTDAKKDADKNSRQLTVTEKAFVAEVTKEIEKACEAHDDEAISLLKPPVTDKAKDIIYGKIHVNDVDSVHTEAFTQNMAFVAPKPAPAATVTEEEKPEVDQINAFARAIADERLARLVMAATLIGQKLDEENSQPMRALNDNFKAFVLQALITQAQKHGIPNDRMTFALAGVAAQLASERPALTSRVLLNALDMHIKRTDAGLTEAGSNLPKPQVSSGIKKLEEPAQIGKAPKMEDSFKPFRR